MGKTVASLIGRRRFLGIWAAAIAGACGAPMADSKQHKQNAARSGRLLSRPAQPESEAPAGLHPLELGGERDGFLYIPATYKAVQPAPLVVMLHGAGGDARGALAILKLFANAAGFVLLVPDSRSRTWDGISGEFGPDVAFIDAALERTFSRCAVDPNRIALAGFSDGASYALSLGLTNGDLFTHAIAFSPGFMAPAELQGQPRLFISHGTKDSVLPIERCSRKIVPQLQRAGYDVVYQEFSGGHSIPPQIALSALRWFMPDKNANVWGNLLKTLGSGLVSLLFSHRL